VEELGQLAIAVIFILFYAISGLKKKRVPPAKRRRPHQAPPAVDAPPDPVEDGDGPPTVSDVWIDPSDRPQTPEQAEQPVARKRSLAEELLGMLEGQTTPETAQVVRLPDIDDEAQSLEVLEPADYSRHEQSLEHNIEAEQSESPYAIDDEPESRPYAVEDAGEERPYVVDDGPASQPYEILDDRRRKKHLTRSELRHAFVMREVLGPPKALEE